MLNKINLENFKGFKNLKNFNFKPITILSGTNSCGKSSILQSIMMMKQTFESKNISKGLSLNGRYVHLGTFENIIHKKDLDNSVKLGFGFQIKKEDYSKKKTGGFPIFLLLRQLISKNAYELEKATYQFDYNVWLKVSDKDKVKSKMSLKPPVIDRLEFSITIRHGKKSFKNQLLR